MEFSFRDSTVLPMCLADPPPCFDNAPIELPRGLPLDYL